MYVTRWRKEALAAFCYRLTVSRYSFRVRITADFDEKHQKSKKFQKKQKFFIDVFAVNDIYIVKGIRIR